MFMLRLRHALCTRLEVQLKRRLARTFLAVARPHLSFPGLVVFYTGHSRVRGGPSYEGDNRPVHAMIALPFDAVTSKSLLSCREPDKASKGIRGQCPTPPGKYHSTITLPDPAFNYQPVRNAFTYSVQYSQLSLVSYGCRAR